MILLRIVLFIAALYIADMLLPFITILEGYKGLLATAGIMYLCNYIITPILRVLTFPITIITLGLSSTILGSLVLYLSLKLNPYLEYTNIWSLFIFVIILNIVWWILNKIL